MNEIPQLCNYGTTMALWHYFGGNFTCIIFPIYIFINFDNKTLYNLGKCNCFLQRFNFPLASRVFPLILKGIMSVFTTFQATFCIKP